MNQLVPIAIFGWPVVVLLSFAVWSTRRAVIVSMLGAWLFLPMAGFKLMEGIPAVTKMSITCMTVFAGAMCFDADRVRRLRWSWADLAVLAWLACPLPSAISAGYGAYEGVSLSFTLVVSWGLPYVIGRLYFGDAAGIRELATGIFLAGLVYAPLVLFEARMSPQLHTWVYGFHQHEFVQARRGEGWRPTVFMQHGLAVAMFMGTAAVCGMWLWTAGRVRGVMGVPAGLLATGLLGVVAACRSWYALLLMVSGSAALMASRRAGTKALMMTLLALGPCYVLARTVGGWKAGLLRDLAAAMGEDRAQSLIVRLTSEDVCWRFMRSSLLFGDGRMDRLMLRESDGQKFIPDGLWLIVLTKNGMFGLAAMFGVLLLPTFLYLRRYSARAIMGAELAGATSVAMVLTLYSLDNLLNAMENPIYLLGAGGLVGLAGAPLAAGERPDGLRRAAC